MDTFDSLLTDPDGLAKVRNILATERAHRNTMSIYEFERYIPLFKYNGRDELAESEYLDLHLEYAERICRFDPVHIVDESNTVILVLPPIFHRTNPMNALGDHGTQMAQAFVNACQSPDDTSKHSRAKYGHIYRQLFEMAQDQRGYEHSKQLAEDLANKATTVAVTDTQPTIEEELPEIEEITSYDLKDNQHTTSSTKVQSEILPYGADEEIEYM